MKWLLRRVLLVCLALTMIFAGVVMLVRLNRTPSTLQQIGFDVCDGEPCFRGVKIGMEWAKARSMFPDAVINGNDLQIPLKSGNIRYIGIRRSYIDTSIESIYLRVVDERYPILQFSIADLVAIYGSPCRVLLSPGLSPVIVRLIYRQLVAVATVELRQSANWLDSHLNLDAPIQIFAITPYSGWEYGSCSAPVTHLAGAWHGFASFNVYRIRFARAFEQHSPNPSP